MLFNTFNYFIFFILIFVIYWSINNKLKNLLLLCASYFFYSCWDIRFSFLLLFSTFLDYYCGIQIYKNKKNNNFKVKFWFYLSILINLSLLFLFKYYNYFIDSFRSLLNILHINLNPFYFTYILPVGISFYTFHGLSYIIDIYKNKIKPEKNIINYSLFVSFFPLLVAGPIERATHLLPQINIKKIFYYHKSVDGLKQILWGLFKKVVIADQCAKYVNVVFIPNNHFTGSTNLLGLFYFSFQIYCDFSGYTDIALGSARLLGFDLIKNFSFPYFSRDIAEFWRRWHISLSSWFKDYLYIPLGGNKGNIWFKIRNTFIIFLVSGIWHGAKTNFIIWGLLNAIFILPSIILNTNKKNLHIVAKNKLVPSLKDIFNITFTFSLTMFAWIFFRSENLNDSIVFIQNIFSFSIIKSPQITTKLLPIILIFILIEWIGRESNYAIENILTKSRIYYRWFFYILIFIMIMIYSTKGQNNTFIYFQF